MGEPSVLIVAGVPDIARTLLRFERVDLWLFERALDEDAHAAWLPWPQPAQTTARAPKLTDLERARRAALGDTARAPSVAEIEREMLEVLTLSPQPRPQ